MYQNLIETTTTYIVLGNYRGMYLKAVYRKGDIQTSIKLAILAEKIFFICRRSLETGKCSCTLHLQPIKIFMQKMLDCKFEFC